MELSANARSSELEFRLENFRLFRDSGWLPISPLTCVVGRNSSGKSSIITALLLLKQSIENEVFGSAITPLALSGQYCDLGQFHDVVHDHNESTEISFSFRLPVENLHEPLARSAPALVPLSTPRLSRAGQGIYRPLSLDENTFKVKGDAALRLTFSADEPFGPSLSRCEFHFSDQGSIRFVRTISGERKQHWRTYSSGNMPKPFVFRPTTRSFFPLISFREKLVKSLNSAETSSAREVLQLCRSFFSYVEALLARSEMIGPFRQPPERRYTFTGFGASRSGPSGEQAIDLLITEALIKKGGQPLLSAVSYWLKELKLVDSLRIRDAAKKVNLFEVDVKLSGKAIRSNLTDVGFGISQVLPVIVQGLLMQRGGIYFVQEPEIHLHPDAQAALADFFIFLAFQGVTSIIETHSEYLLLRLRRRLAEKGRPSPRSLPRIRQSRGPISTADIAFLFAHSSKHEATITKLEIGPGFQFENLPSGFMSQITDDRMALLKAVNK